tara:strand:- start:2121 stop:2831 length:711 start_codon:yes stop_codon:yes gene_type:complete
MAGEKEDKSGFKYLEQIRPGTWLVENNGVQGVWNENSNNFNPINEESLAFKETIGPPKEDNLSIPAEGTPQQTDIMGILGGLINNPFIANMLNQAQIAKETIDYNRGAETDISGDTVYPVGSGANQMPIPTEGGSGIKSHIEQGLSPALNRPIEETRMNVADVGFQVITDLNNRVDATLNMLQPFVNKGLNALLPGSDIDYLNKERWEESYDDTMDTYKTNLPKVIRGESSLQNLW